MIIDEIAAPEYNPDDYRLAQEITDPGMEGFVEDDFQETQKTYSEEDFKKIKVLGKGSYGKVYLV